jgi:hypothetical protein
MRTYTPVRCCWAVRVNVDAVAPAPSTAAKYTDSAEGGTHTVTDPATSVLVLEVYPVGQPHVPDPATVEVDDTANKAEDAVAGLVQDVQEYDAVVYGSEGEVTGFVPAMQGVRLDIVTHRRKVLLHVSGGLQTQVIFDPVGGLAVPT